MAKPLITTVGKNVELKNLEVFANGSNVGQPRRPSGELGEPANGSALMIQSDNTTLKGLMVRSAWDNGIMVKRYRDYDLQKCQLNALPTNVSISKCVTLNCGIGPRVLAGKEETKGAGFNVGTGRHVRVTDCLDIGSSTGFTCDVHGTAEGIFTRCVAIDSHKRDGDPEGTGVGFWIASDARLTECRAIRSETYGFRIDPMLGPRMSN